MSESQAGASSAEPAASAAATPAITVTLQPQQQPAPKQQPTAPPQRQFKRSEGGASGDKPAEVNQSMPIPADRVGWIIGKQGINIQGLSQRSGCAISVSDWPSKEYGREWNYIHLQGTTRNVDRAKKLIYMRLENFRATPPWSGHQHQQ